MYLQKAALITYEYHDQHLVSSLKMHHHMQGLGVCYSSYYIMVSTNPRQDLQPSAGLELGQTPGPCKPSSLCQ